MAFDDALLDLMPDTVSVAALASFSTDGYGEPVYSTSAVSYRCRYVSKQVEVTSFDGSEEVANTVIWCKSSSTFHPSDKLSIGGVQLGPVLRVEQSRDEDGHHHSRIFCG